MTGIATVSTMDTTTNAPRVPAASATTRARHVAAWTVNAQAAITQSVAAPIATPTSAAHVCALTVPAAPAATRPSNYRPCAGR
jgi:hypothetical protein